MPPPQYNPHHPAFWLTLLANLATLAALCWIIGGQYTMP